METYDEFIKNMNSAKWHFYNKKTPQIITNQNTEIVTTHKVKNGDSGYILEVTCPSSHVLTINGLSLSPRLLHHLSIQCRDKNNNELSAETKIDILKLDFTNCPKVRLCSNYRELSQTMGSRSKAKGEMFYLKHLGFILYGTEKLAVYIYNADIDIVKIDFYMTCDIFERSVG
ncbi:MAG: hypothetical protein PHZ02_01505 [Desulfocapsaceae bacterium]|nr:hypothetical protein [Desulfocapsaceae bacterium]